MHWERCVWHRPRSCLAGWAVMECWVPWPRSCCPIRNHPKPRALPHLGVMLRIRGLGGLHRASAAGSTALEVGEPEVMKGTWLDGGWTQGCFGVGGWQSPG